MRKLGPGFLITAAFIGPGTVTTATMAGAQFGYTLVWVVCFSVIATMILQEMAARLGIVTQKGLAEAMRLSIDNIVLRSLALLLVICAIGVGNTAYQAGNFTGAALGLQSILGGEITQWVLVIAAFSAALLATGIYAVIRMVLTLLVFIMSAVFIVTMWISNPDFSAIFEGVLSPSIPEGGLLTTIALIGTTIVPYNLFLHASLAKHNIANRTENNQTMYVFNNDMTSARTDSGIAIGLGGLITLAIVCTSAASFFAHGVTATSENLALQLEPLLGEHAKLFFAAGLLSAGVTSAVTAPLAAAYTICGVFGWSVSPKAIAFRIVWFLVLAIGAAVCFTGIKPLNAILFAQASNGLLLPIIAGFLLWVMNRRDILGDYTNGPISNTFGGAIVVLVSALGIYKLVSIF
ncbi:Nramp family divalent metal transporter [Paraneptunicella aestuarii]|uniref:Nramp family divalent metal transporter n=1 Tax=Paraneptunicella aestuarii TaxID=2831148 RepID=UPI001E3C8FCA|nr:Nramp family divalent metal transporter [Paraneptunicella aestuarii]UAA39249.1 Nramp family divalent metal transporter [Paraneptunicella aestuarii]